jgi:hypothetical protein
LAEKRLKDIVEVVLLNRLVAVALHLRVVLRLVNLHLHLRVVLRLVNLHLHLRVVLRLVNLHLHGWKMPRVGLSVRVWKMPRVGLSVREWKMPGVGLSVRVVLSLVNLHLRVVLVAKAQAALLLALVKALSDFVIIMSDRGQVPVRVRHIA